MLSLSSRQPCITWILLYHEEISYAERLIESWKMDKSAFLKIIFPKPVYVCFSEKDLSHGQYSLCG